MPTKPFWKSGTIWGSLLLGLPLLVQFIAQRCGVDLSDVAKPFGAQVTKTFQDAVPFVTDCVQLAGFVMAIVGRFNAHKSQVTLTSATPLSGPGVTKALVLIASILILVPLALMISGCAGTLPAGFTSPPLTTGEVSFSQNLANIDTPAALKGTEAASATATSIGMYVGIKQTTTMQTDGLVLFGAGTALEDFSTQTIPGSSPVAEIFTGLKTSATAQQSAQNYDAISQSLNAPLSLVGSWIQSGVNSTTDPDVKAYAAKVFCDQVHAVGKGVCDATQQYSGNTTLPALTLSLIPDRNLYAAAP